jgi:hypothetical protein
MKTGIYEKNGKEWFFDPNFMDEPMELDSHETSTLDFDTFIERSGFFFHSEREKCRFYSELEENEAEMM